LSGQLTRAIVCGIPKMRVAVIESLATEAEGRFRDGVWDSIERETTYVEYWLRDHLPSDTDATDE
jgi:hypothetical protein